MATIIILKNRFSRGKTSTLMKLYEIMESYLSDYKVNDTRDIYFNVDLHAVVEIENIKKEDKKIILIATKGDSIEAIEHLEESISDNNPDIVFCTATIDEDINNKLQSLENRHKLIWTSTYSDLGVDDKTKSTQMQTVLNKIKAEQLLDLLIKLELI
jgi:hypothetical protein